MPFWKKTDKGGKKKPPKSAVPRTAQQSIPMQRMFEDGTCRVKPNYYSLSTHLFFMEKSSLLLKEICMTLGL